jgi:uncharacterized protein YbjT (DUF2867 family)
LAFRAVDYEAVLAFADWGAGLGAKRFFVVTAMGANVRSPFFYSRVKGEVEAILRTRPFHELHIFRPSLLLGPRAENRPGERFAQKMLQSIPFLTAGPLAGLRPIEAATVARAMRVAAMRPHSDEGGVFVYEPDEIRALAGA